MHRSLPSKILILIEKELIEKEDAAVGQTFPEEAEPPVHPWRRQ